MSRFVLTAQLQLQAPTNVAQVVRQIQSQLNNVTVNVQVQNSQRAQRQLQQLTQQTNQATSAAERMGRAFAVSVRRFAAFSIATRAVGLFTSTLSDAVQTAIDFERQLIKISQVTGENVSKLNKLTSVITELSTGLGVASNDLLNVSTTLLQAGLSSKDTEVALKSLAKAALAPNFDSISETAEGAIAILAQFGQGVQALEGQLGSINAVAGAFAVEASDLIDVIRRTGGVFKASGGDLNELLALFTSVRATTRESAESIGTGLRTIFTRIQRPKTIEYLKQFGVELVDLEGKFVGPFEAVKRLSAALSGLGEGDITFIRIAEELGGFRQIGKVLPLLQQFSVAQQALNVANKAGNSLTQDAATAQQALAIRIVKVKEEFLALVRSITETSTFQVMANTALSLASALIKIGDSIKPLLPLLGALAALKVIKGISTFAGGVMGGLSSSRTFNKGGKVHHFARGGLVPGAGNRDTVPAMLAPGEFVIRKSSVNKMGAGTLAAMNENRYAYGGKARTFGIAALDGTPDSKSSNLPISAIREKLGINTDKVSSKNLDMVIRGVLGAKGSSNLNVTAKSDTVTLNDPGIKDAIYNNIKSQMYGLITSSATALSTDTGIPIRKRVINPNKVLAKVGTDSTIGSVFEGALGLLGGPFSAGKSTAAIDYPRGLGKMASAFSSLSDMPVDAKKTADSKKTSEMLNKKIPNFFAEFVKRSPQYASFKSQIIQGKLDKLKGKEFDLDEYRRVTGNSKANTGDLSQIASISRKSGNRQFFTLRNLGGIIQKFADGGIIQRGMEKYSSSDIVKAMSEISGKTLSEKEAIDLFTSRNARGDFVYSNFGGIKLPKWFTTYKAPLSTMESKILNANKTLDSDFNDPRAYRGARSSGRYKRYAVGGSVDPKDTLERFYTDASPFNLGLANSKSLSKSQRTQLASDVRNMRKLRTEAPKTLYSSISRVAFDRMASQTGLNKNPKIPEGTKLFDREKYYQEAVNKIIGKTFNLPGFVSTSKDFNKAKSFLDNAPRSEDNWAAMMTILTKQNAQGVDVSQQLLGRTIKASKQEINPRTGKMETLTMNQPKSENEFALSPRSRFKINNAKFADMMGRKNLWMDVQQFATGGGVGTDTVPALLTPGEFVINKKSAQTIGYGSLNRMNKVGRYAKGGTVQKFQNGGTPTYSGTGPVLSGGGNLIPFDTLSRQAGNLYIVQQQLTQQTTQNTQSVSQNTQAQNQQRKGIKETVAANKMFAASMTVGLIQGFLPALDENSSSLTRMSHSLVGLISTITTVGFALEAFNIQLKTRAILDLLSGAKSLSDTFKSMSSLKSLTAGFNRGIAGSSKQATSFFGKIGQGAGSTLSRGRGIASSIGGRINAFGSSVSSNIGQTSFGKTIGRIGRSASSGFSQGMRGMPGAQAYFARGASPFMQGVSKTATRLGGRAGQLVGNFSSGAIGRSVGSLRAGIGVGMNQGFGATQLTRNVAGAGGLSGKIGQGLGSAGASISKGLGQALGTITKGLNAVSGPLLLVQLGLMAASSAVNSFFDYQNQANKAIQEGNSAKASENAVNAAAQESIDSFGSSAILAGAAIGSLFPVVGPLIGGIIGAGVALTAKFLPALEKAIFGTDVVNQAFIGLGTLFGGNTYDSIKSLAEAQAQGVKTQKALNDAGELVTKAMQDLENGSISAAQAVAASSAAGAEVNKQIEMNKKAAAANEGNKSGMIGGFLRGTARVATLGLAGYMGLESGAQRNARIDQENKGLSEQSKKSQEDLIAKSTPAINAFSADIAAAGGTFDDVLANLDDRASAAYNPGLYQALIQQGTNPLRQAFDNVKKEIDRAQKAFNAMNLGMQNVQGAAAAAALSVTNYVSAQQAGNIPLQQSLATLEASVTSAAQGISDADFATALGDAEDTLRKFGANDQQINKFKQNLQAVNSVQKNSSEIFAQTKDELSANIRKSTSADARKKAFTKTIGANLTAQGVDPEIVKRIQDAAGNLTDDQLKKIGEGHFSVFDAAMKELGEKTLEQVRGPAEAAIKIQEELNGLTKRRIELERNLADAQVEALNVRMEARDIQAKYGGKAVTPAERRQNIIDVANTQANNVSGVGRLTTGNAADIQRRSAEIAARQAELGAVRNRAAAGDKDAMRQISNESGLQLEEEERKLAQAAKDQLTATRELIKAKEQELQITQEKNKLEKQSMESLITGDIEKFFEQQAAVGATAAIATGNETLMNQFGASALAGAYTDIQRQQEAGVQSLYGQQLGGAGGLSEQAAQAALRARGVQSQAAAQMMANTTPEQEAIKADIRALAETMGPTADLQTQAADLQLQAAQMQLQAAQARGESSVQQMEARQMARGGVVYANRGMFIPRGTDTVPAMLTPGEFVVNRAAVQRGNNLQMLQAMNGGAGAVGYSRGGSVQYLRTGGQARGDGMIMPSIDPKLITDLSSALNGFNTELAKNIQNLQGTKFQIKLDTTSINININGTSFLATLKESIQKEFMGLVAGEISKYRVGPNGSLSKSESVLG